MNPILEIFSQGEEIISGHTVDTNAAWLSQQAVKQGFSVTRHTAVGDNMDDLVSLLREIAGRADCCLCTGGLGPTSDDLTAEAVSLAFDLPLVFDAEALATIQQYFSYRNKAMPEANRKQAMLPEGCQRLDNEWGTAPGFALHSGRCWFVFLPGVPSEMKPMFLEKILPTLTSGFDLKPSNLVTIKTVGLGESDIQQRINAITMPDGVKLGFRASLNEVQTKLLFPHNYAELSIDLLVERITRLLGNSVYAIDKPGEDSGDLATVVNALMTAHKKSLAVVETISQGLIAGFCVGSDWLLESRYEQSLARITRNLGIDLDETDLMEIANEIAGLVQVNSGADFVLVQLYNGERQQLNDKTQTVFIFNVLLTADGYVQENHRIGGSGLRKRQQSALLALDLLRRYLQHESAI